MPAKHSLALDTCQSDLQHFVSGFSFWSIHDQTVDELASRTSYVLGFGVNQFVAPTPQMSTSPLLTVFSYIEVHP